jgi:D-sedoheptulose 7-phosphate isomerase|tara:strand:+ start:1298 stop:1843 length:546 start_codon:yes stop_codon:yes gene_type:complete
MKQLAQNYLVKLNDTIKNVPIEKINLLIKKIDKVKKNNNKLFICGNGGSAANAIHIANDFIFTKSSKKKMIDVEALTSNNAIITCISNDVGYKYIFSKQLENKAKKNDLLLLLSGSGNSENLIEAIKVAKLKKMETFAILGFNGGKCKKLVKNNIHIDINDMQISEDFQLIIGHIILKSLI